MIYSKLRKKAQRVYRELGNFFARKIFRALVFPRTAKIIYLYPPLDRGPIMCYL